MLHFQVNGDLAVAEMAFSEAELDSGLKRPAENSLLQTFCLHGEVTHCCRNVWVLDQEKDVLGPIFFFQMRLFILGRRGEFWCGLRWFGEYRYVSSQNTSSREWNMEPLEWFRLSGSHHKLVMLCLDHKGIKVYRILLNGTLYHYHSVLRGGPTWKILYSESRCYWIQQPWDHIRAPFGGIITSPMFHDVSMQSHSNWRPIFKYLI